MFYVALGIIQIYLQEFNSLYCRLRINKVHICIYRTKIMLIIIIDFIRVCILVNVLEDD